MCDSFSGEGQVGVNSVAKHHSYTRSLAQVLCRGFERWLTCAYNVFCHKVTSELTHRRVHNICAKGEMILFTTLID
jgi:hypothetical protein